MDPDGISPDALAKLAAAAAATGVSLDAVDSAMRHLLKSMAAQEEAAIMGQVAPQAPPRPQSVSGGNGGGGGGGGASGGVAFDEDGGAFDVGGFGGGGGGAGIGWTYVTTDVGEGGGGGSSLDTVAYAGSGYAAMTTGVSIPRRLAATMRAPDPAPARDWDTPIGRALSIGGLRPPQEKEK